MPQHDKELEKNAQTDNTDTEMDMPCQQRRRLLGILGIGIAAAYVAPTLFSAGQAEARYRYNKRGSYSPPVTPDPVIQSTAVMSTVVVNAAAYVNINNTRCLL